MLGKERQHHSACSHRGPSTGRWPLGVEPVPCSASPAEEQGHSSRSGQEVPCSGSPRVGWGACAGSQSSSQQMLARHLLTIPLRPCRAQVLSRQQGRLGVWGEVQMGAPVRVLGAQHPLHADRRQPAPTCPCLPRLISWTNVLALG